MSSLPGHKYTGSFGPPPPSCVLDCFLGGRPEPAYKRASKTRHLVPICRSGSVPTLAEAGMQAGTEDDRANGRGDQIGT
jgi:hypothetical protein